MTNSGDLNTELLWYSNGRKEVGCQIVRFLNAIWILDSPTIWILDKWMPSCFLMFWSSIQMVGLVHRPLDWPFEYRPFEIWTSKSLVFKCFRFSNVSGIQMVCIQILTVMGHFLKWPINLMPSESGVFRWFIRTMVQMFCVLDGFPYHAIFYYSVVSCVLMAA